jgi:hypothetical protein
MGSVMNIIDILRTCQLNIKLPRKFFKSDKDLYIYIGENIGSPADRYYRYSSKMNQIVRVKKIKINISLKNELVLCSEEEFLKQVEKTKMMNELIK